MNLIMLCLNLMTVFYNLHAVVLTTAFPVAMPFPFSFKGCVWCIRTILYSVI